MTSFQLTGDSSNMDATALPGYDADDDTAVGEHSVCSEESTSTPIRKCRPSPWMRVPCRRKRRRHERPQLSIFHNDIDSNITTHTVASRQQRLQQRKPTASSEPAMSLYDLSHMLEDYFQQQHASYEETPAQVSDEDYLSAEQEVYFSGFSRSRGNSPSQVGIISTSERCLFLEDALGLSSSARILVEASALHRVVHTNAAFCRFTAKEETSQNKQASSMARVQECFRTGMPIKSFDSVVSAMFADRAVTVYPVQDSDGSGVIRYYLVEHTIATATATTTMKKRLAANIADLSQTVG
jgi:hypothetical protein